MKILALLACLGIAHGEEPVRYVALGDSYSIGEGATPAESWPALLTKDLAAHGLAIELVANPSVTGWTTRQAIDRELPILLKSRPTFATLQIGVNDWVQGVSAEEFHQRLVSLLDQMQAALPDKQKLLLVTIPDFSVTPTGARYVQGRDAVQGLGEFNRIIGDEARARHLPVVDLFPLSHHLSTTPANLARDGLHPSAAQYAEWEKLIFPVALRLLTLP